MRAITIQQPFATLIVLGIKKFETRRFEPHFTGTMLIHAAQIRDRCLETYVRHPHIFDLIKQAGVDPHSLPKGAIIGAVNVKSSQPTQNMKPDHVQSATGFWGKGNYAWQLEDPVSIKPVRMPGRPDIWEIDGRHDAYSQLAAAVNGSHFENEKGESNNARR